MLVAVRPPTTPPVTPQRLVSVAYTRPLPHVKHLGGFGQIHHGKLAEQAGFDDALLTSDGVVVEGAIANIGFFDHGGGVVWPRADWLHGITMQLLERELPSRREVVRSVDVGRYRSLKDLKKRERTIDWGDNEFEKALRTAVSIPERVRHGLFELALPFEIPSLVAVAIFSPSLGMERSSPSV